MTALEFHATLNPDGTVQVPNEMAAQLKDLTSFRVVVLVPSDDEREDDEAWQKFAMAEFFKGYSDADSIYDDL